jgi:1-deoxy-D-xylulose-5-phosphate synthase
MKEAVEFAYNLQTPCSFRYPRGAFLPCGFKSEPFELGKSQLLKDGKSDILLIGYGNGVGRACETEKLLKDDVAILDLKFVKPLDVKALQELSKRYKRWYVFSDSSKMGGVGSAIQELGIKDIEITSFEYEDEFTVLGTTILVEKSMGLLPEQLAKKIV